MGPWMTLADSVATHARTRPCHLAVRDSRRSLTYREWHERASRLANSLLARGVQPGDRVALLAYNAIEWLEIYAALAQARLVAVPVNFRLRAAEIAYILGHSEARAFIVQAPLRDEAEAALALAQAEGHEVDTSKRFLFGADVAPAAGWHLYESLMSKTLADEVPVRGLAGVTGVTGVTGAGGDHPPARADDLFALMYTSGTTGRPKGAMRSHQGNAWIAWATALEFGLSADDTGLLVMPLCHANSLYFAVTFAMLGASIVVDDRPHFDPAATLAALAQSRITFTSLVPTHYIMMLGLPAEVTSRHDLRAVGKLLISSAPARAETKRAVMSLFPNARLFELYGSTEAGWVTILRPDEQLDRLGTVGREWAGSGAIRLLDPEGREVPDGEVGELYSRTAYVFDGYWKNPDRTAEAFRGAWCSVGDLAVRDDDGYIRLVDRKSHMIISGGENIYPSEVESVLAAHPSVQDVAVVGVPDSTWGESVLAVVVCRPGYVANEAELLDWCRPRIAGYKRPRAVRFISEAQMPRTATGKIQHRLLREQMATSNG
ncbi:AMP-binding protein [Ideonella sp. DXS29W]|uniref:AMP-binding protein n=1 Tax=Ideonella lacteola TaxID=2984193 RepID=A0ABU9BRC0_9BURK